MGGEESRKLEDTIDGICPSSTILVYAASGISTSPKVGRTRSNFPIRARAISGVLSLMSYRRVIPQPVFNRVLVEMDYREATAAELVEEAQPRHSGELPRLAC